MPKENDNLEERLDPDEYYAVRSPKWTDDHYALAVETGRTLGRPICGALTRHRGVCKQHPNTSNGNGRCRFHGANAGRPIKHGVYSKRLPKGKLLDTFEGFLGDAEIYELDAEIALLRTRLTDFINRNEELPASVKKDPEWLYKATTIYVRMIEAIAKLQLCRERLDKTDCFTTAQVNLHVKRHRLAFFTAAHAFLKDPGKLPALFKYYIREFEQPKEFKRLLADTDVAALFENAATEIMKRFK